MQFTIAIDRDEDDSWNTEYPSILDCVSQGQTKEEAIANIRETIQLCLEVRTEKGLPQTIETRQLDVAVCCYLFISLPGVFTKAFLERKHILLRSHEPGL